MRALQLISRNPAQICLSEVPIPNLKPNHSIVKIETASLNRVDAYMRDDGRGITHTLPQIMGVDGAGIIHETQNKSGFVVGDKVAIYPYIFCGKCDFCKTGQETLCDSAKILGEHIDGTMCEYMCVPNQCLAKISDERSMSEAAAIGVAYLTAWGMLFNKARITADKTILIQGAAGGVSYAAMSLAQMVGAKIIITTTGKNKIDHFKNLGVDIIDYKKQDIVQEVQVITQKRGVDIVVDNVGGEMFDISLRCLAKGACLITCGATIGANPPLKIQRLFVKQLSIHGSTMANLSDFHEMIKAFNNGSFKPQIDSIYELNRFSDAFLRLESKDRIGKVIIKI